MPQDPTQQEMEKIGDAITAGRTIEAIKLYRSITGSDLGVSKDFIEKLEAGLRASQPERFAARPAFQDARVLKYWTLWFAFSVSEIIIYSVLYKQSVANPDLNPSFWIAGAIPVILSTINRWMVLPRFKKIETAFLLFVLGLALAEVSLLLGLILFPGGYREILFALSFAGTLQYIPLFAGKLTR